MSDVIYSLDGTAVAVLLWLLMMVAVEAGLRLGRRTGNRLDDQQQEQIGTVQASIIGMLALMLGFTFSMALGRYDSRSDAVVDEANAIGTTWLRTALLAEPARSESRALLREYVAVRVEAGNHAMSDVDERARLLARAETLQASLWDTVIRQARQDPGPVTTGLYLQSLNETIDSYGRRVSGLERHVPDSVLLLLYGALIVTGGVIGFRAGTGGHRPPGVTYVMITLIVLIMFLVMDMDRPQRGLIRVDQTPLHALAEQVARALPEASPAAP